MRFSHISACALLMLYLFAGPSFAQDADTFTLQQGQVWTFDAPAAQERARMIVSKIEDHAEYGPIVHVSLVNVSTEHPESGQPTLLSIMHMPFSREAVQDSVRDLDGDSDPPEQFEQALAYWARSGRGVWTVSVGTALRDMLSAAQSGNPAAIKVR